MISGLCQRSKMKRSAQTVNSYIKTKSCMVGRALNAPLDLDIRQQIKSHFKALLECC